MADNGIITPYDDLGYSFYAKGTVSWAYNAAAAVRTQPGRLCKVVVTTALTSGGTGTLLFYDNASAASGTVVFGMSTAAANPVGTVFAIDVPLSYGLYVVATSLTGGVLTIGYV